MAFSPSTQSAFLQKCPTEMSQKTDIRRKTNNNMDLFSNIKNLLIIGKLLFLIPCDGFSWKSHEEFVFRRNSFPSVIAFLFISWCVVKDFVGFKFLMQVSHGGVIGYVHPAHYFIISSVITFIYAYFCINVQKLKNLFVVWDKVAVNFDLNVYALKRFTCCAVVLMSLPFIINILFTIDLVYPLGGQVSFIPPNVTRLEYGYEMLLKHWHAILPFSKSFTIFCLFDFVWGSFPRSFVLTSVIVFSYALSRQFKDLVEKTKARSDSDGTLLSNQEFWLQVTKKHNVLTDMVAQFDSFFSPLIFITYITSLYLICIQLLRALSSNTGGGIGTELTLGLSTFIFNMSFCAEVLYLYLMTISAAQINDYAHQIANALRECPMEYHTFEVSRLENRVYCGPQIGFTGLGCFVITKPFLLTIANAAMTLEIVLLQAQFTQPVLGLH